eukprot:COSAG04_NODE_15593_length_527_cov_0.764019_1_plen_100_part_01
MAEESPPPPGDDDSQPWQGSPKKPKAALGEQSAGVKWKVGALPNASPAFGQSSFLGGKPGSGAATVSWRLWRRSAAPRAPTARLPPREEKLATARCILQV